MNLWPQLLLLWPLLRLSLPLCGASPADMFNPDDASVTVGAGFACSTRGDARDDNTSPCWGPGAPRITWRRDIVQLSAAAGHVCALRGIDGAVACWGGRMGSLRFNVEDAVQITAGESVVCVLLASGSVDCQGALSLRRCTACTTCLMHRLLVYDHVGAGSNNRGQATPPADVHFLQISCGKVRYTFVLHAKQPRRMTLAARLEQYTTIAGDVLRSHGQHIARMLGFYLSR